MKNRLLLLSTVLLFGCGSPTQKPHYQFVFLTSYYESYLDALARKSDATDVSVKNTNADADSLFRWKVFSPLYKIFAHSEYNFVAKSELEEPIQDTLTLRKTIKALKTNEEKIKNKITATFDRCNTYLHSDHLTIYICPAYSEPDLLKKMKGIYGFTAGSHQISLSISPETEGWEDMLDFTAAHEFQHAQWTQDNYFNRPGDFTLLDCMVFEGKADSFAHLLYPNVKPTWLYSLSEKDHIELWHRLKSKLNSTDLAFQNEVMYRSNNYPDWSGYILGYSIVQAALHQGSQLKPLQWTALDADSLLKMSQYSL